MSSDRDNSRGGTEAVEQKLDALSASVDERFAILSTSLDERFGAVDEALVEQRRYTEFAFDQLRGEMRNGFDAVNARLGGVEGRFDSVESRFNRLERKLDQFIDTQSRTNALVERRLTSLEAPSGQE